MFYLHFNKKIELENPVYVEPNNTVIEPDSPYY